MSEWNDAVEACIKKIDPAFDGLIATLSALKRPDQQEPDEYANVPMGPVGATYIGNYTHPEPAQSAEPVAWLLSGNFHQHHGKHYIRSFTEDKAIANDWISYGFPVVALIEYWRHDSSQRVVLDRDFALQLLALLRQGQDKEKP